MRHLLFPPPDNILCSHEGDSTAYGLWGVVETGSQMPWRYSLYPYEQENNRPFNAQ